LIRVIAVCVFRDGNRILVAEEVDAVTKSRFARPLGGGVDDGERSEEAAEREIREEIGQEICELRLLGVLENIFEYLGKHGHEIVFVYDGKFVDPANYQRAEIPMMEAGWETPAVWRDLGEFGPERRLVPEGLMGLLKRA
jgi:ADP-ribose pyrophosphatase YjhB (NUDIX family)